MKCRRKKYTRKNVLLYYFFYFCFVRYKQHTLNNQTNDGFFPHDKKKKVTIHSHTMLQMWYIQAYMISEKKYFQWSNYSPDALTISAQLRCFLQAGLLPASCFLSAPCLGIHFPHDGLCLVLVDGLAVLLHQVVLLPGLGHLLGASIEALRQLQVFDALQLKPLPPL